MWRNRRIKKAGWQARPLLKTTLPFRIVGRVERWIPHQWTGAGTGVTAWTAGVGRDPALPVARTGILPRGKGIARIGRLKLVGRRIYRLLSFPRQRRCDRCAAQNDDPRNCDCVREDRFLLHRILHFPSLGWFHQKI